MDPGRFTRVDPITWRIEPTGAMRVPAIIYADIDLLTAMDDKVFEQVTNVAKLPGIVKASYAMPDAHWGYGFPIGGVAAFDAEAGGVVSAGGVGFDISCGVRTMLTGLRVADILPVQRSIADSLYRHIPAGVGSEGAIELGPLEMDEMLSGGARWAVEQGWGEEADLDRIEEAGTMAGARPDCVSERAKDRQRREMGTLGSGNHYLEVQAVAEIFDDKTAAALVFARMRWLSRFTAVRAGSAIKSAANSSAAWRLGRRKRASSCLTGNWPARRSIPNSARTIWVPCGRR